MTKNFQCFLGEYVVQNHYTVSVNGCYTNKLIAAFVYCKAVKTLGNGQAVKKVIKLNEYMLVIQLFTEYIRQEECKILHVAF